MASQHAPRTGFLQRFGGRPALAVRLDWLANTASRAGLESAPNSVQRHAIWPRRRRPGVARAERWPAGGSGSL